MDLVKVWPLVEGLSGYNAYGHPINLSAFSPGWMSQKAAMQAVDSGQVQIMAGLRPSDLRQMSTPRRKVGRPPNKPGHYSRSDMTSTNENE